jgi:hypothetical protein
MFTLLETGLLLTITLSGAFSVGYCVGNFRKAPRRIPETTLASQLRT